MSNAATMSEQQEAREFFNLKKATACNASRVKGHDPVKITMAPQQWAYAAIFPLHDASKYLLTGAGRLVVRIDATVQEGHMGVAVAETDLREFISEEKQSGVGSRVMLEVTANSPRPGIWLVIRNTAANGVVTRAEIHSVSARLIFDPPSRESIDRPAGQAGLEVFDSSDAIAINRARLQHLASLQLPIEGKSVLDVGCGVGHLSVFFADRGCRVVCVDGRAENLERLKTLYSGRETHVANVEVDSLAAIGRFDVVFCFGLLYHTENPIAALRNITSCCQNLLLLETVITDSSRPIVQLADEPNATMNQALSGFGCRPSPAYVAMALMQMGFPFVFTTKTQPDFPDFHFEYRDDSEWRRDGHLLRRVFVASRTPLSNRHLMPVAGEPQTPTASVREIPTANMTEVWIDVGAHLGEKTFHIAAERPGVRVYAFEPNLEVASQLMGRLPNYVVLPMAVAETDGSADFYVNEFEAASSLLPFHPPGLAKWIGGEVLKIAQAIPVPTIRLETFLNRTGIREVSYLKIDAQGADLAVIRSAGARLSSIRRISLEVQITDDPLYAGASDKDAVVSYLTNAGYVLVSAEQQSHGQEENLTFERPVS